MEDPMATTSLIVETLIAGFQTLVGVVLWLVLFWGLTWINLSALKDWAGLLLLFVIAGAYTLGILIERTASFFIAIIDDRLAVTPDAGTPVTEMPIGNLVRIRQFFGLIFRRLPSKQRVSASEIRMKIMTANTTVSSYIEGYRQQYRMLAATTLNILIYLILIFLAWREPGWLSPETPIQDFAKHQAPQAFGILLVLFLVTALHWWRMRHNYQEHAKKAHDLLYPPQNQPPDLQHT